MVSTTTDVKQIPKGPWFGVRHVQVLLIFFLLMAGGCLRCNINIAIVAMTGNNTSNNPDVPVYGWTNTGVVLSSFYWGYSIVQFFMGQIAHLYGAKWFLFGAIFSASLSETLIPLLAAQLGSEGVIGCRVVTGIASGVTVPLIQATLGKWAPENERSWMTGYIYAGFSVGSIISTALCGYLSSTWSGWPASFYVVGSVGFLWCIFWAVLGSNSPAEHPRIGLEEKTYIETSLGQDEVTKVKTPWKSIFTSLPYWAIVVASIGESWGTTTLHTETPTYFAKITGIDIKHNGLFSSAPSAAALVLGLCFGPLSDYLIAKKYCTRLAMRKIFQGIASFIPALALSCLTYVDDQVSIAALFIVSSAVLSGFFCGHQVNNIDISPRFAGVIHGIANGTGQTVAILAPLYVQYVVSDETDRIQWRQVFVTAAGFYVVTAMFFIIFAKADRQPWDSGDQKRRKENNTGSIKYIASYL